MSTGRAVDGRSVGEVRIESKEEGDVNRRLGALPKRRKIRNLAISVDTANGGLKTRPKFYSRLEADCRISQQSGNEAWTLKTDLELITVQLAREMWPKTRSKDQFRQFQNFRNCPT